MAMAMAMTGSSRVSGGVQRPSCRRGGAAGAASVLPRRGLGLRRGLGPPGAVLSSEEVATLRDAATEAATLGSEVVRSALDEPVEVEMKMSTSDLVTKTDKATEDEILGFLRARYPDHMILGEEGGYTGNPSSDFLWCVDPLDGTTNFAHRFPSFATSVGLVYKGVAVAGSVVEFTGGPYCWQTR